MEKLFFYKKRNYQYVVDIDISPNIRRRHDIRRFECSWFAIFSACSLLEGEVQFSFGTTSRQQVAQIPSPRQDCAIGILCSRKTRNRLLPFGTEISLLSWGIEITRVSSCSFFLLFIGMLFLFRIDLSMLPRVTSNMYRLIIL